jgi:hypothetical protein
MIDFTDADVERHMGQIARRELAELAELAANRRAEHPRNLAEWIGEGDVLDSPPVIERKATGSMPLKMNRGAGVPKEET